MKTIWYSVLFVCFSLCAFSQEYYSVSGYVKDTNTGEALIGALVYETTHNKSVITNGYGYYSFSLPAGKCSFNCSYLGYNSHNEDMVLTQDTLRDIFLQPTFISVESVIITAEKPVNPIRINEFNTEKITAQSISRTPTMFGEADVIKTIQLQSGVKTLGDGSSGMFIRGGSSDQNLIVIDEAPIYNPSHLFGLISVFNPDALNYVYVYKSNMPAQYGGRVSSVIDCKMKEGNMYEHDFSVGISPFSGIVTVNGPIVPEKSSFFISGRKSLIDLAFNPGRNLALVPAFYDVNMKINTKIGSKNRLFFSFYNGNDVLESVDGFYNTWGNTSGTLRWNRNFGSKLFVNTSCIVSDYRNFLEFKDTERDYTWRTGVSDVNVKCDATYYVHPGNEIKFGLGSIYHRF
ncbi:MAG: TonB-dependent receptor, partial [Bacteroidota bacterium]